MFILQNKTRGLYHLRDLIIDINYLTYSSSCKVRKKGASTTDVGLTLLIPIGRREDAREYGTDYDNSQWRRWQCC